MFEESKVWIILSLVAVLISFGYGVHYLNSVDEANLALQESKSKLTDMHELLFHRKKDWNDREVAVAKVQAETDKNATLLKAKEILNKRYHQAESDLKYVLESMQSSVEKVRANAAGTELGELTLANGKVLRTVKVRKVDDAGISLIHADGIGTIAVDQLTENLNVRFDLGPNALIPVIEQALTSFLSKPADEDAKPEPVINTPNPATQTKPATGAVDDSKVKKIKLRMAELDSRISSFTASADQYQNAAASHQALAANALTRGQPTTRHKENANDNLAQAAAIERQLAVLREERKKLNIELEYALKND